MANQIMTPLEEQVMKDYGKYMYKSVALPEQQKLPPRLGAGLAFNNSFSNLNNIFGGKNIFGGRASSKQPDYYAELKKALPTGVSLENNNLRIDPSSKYFNTEGNVLQAIQKDLSNSSKNPFANMMGAMHNTFSLGLPGYSAIKNNPFAALAGPQVHSGALDLLGNYSSPSSTGFGYNSLFNNFRLNNTTPAAPKVQTIEVTRTPDEQLQEYLRRQPGMTLDQLKAQIEQKRQAMANMPTMAPQSLGKPMTIEELIARYYQGGNPFSQGYAKGGEVKGYARGTEDGAFDEESAATIMPYQMPEAPIAQAIPQPNYAPITSGQVEPSGGGATPQAPQMAPAMTMANPELNALIQQYNTSADYGPELRQARADRRASEASFNKSLDMLMSGADEGPSKAEMYWKLAAAFGTPSKTGAFGEGLAQAAGAMAETKKEERTTGLAKRKLKADIAIKKQEMALEGAKDTEKTLLGLDSEQRKDKREFIKAQVKEYIDSGKPQSNAGKIAKDKGFKPGTEEYQAEVDKQVNLEIEKQLGAINAQLQSGKIALANLGISQEKASREAIKLEPDERKAIRDDEDAMFAAKSTIKNLTTAVGFVDQAFTNTAADQAAYKKLKQTNPNDPRVKATEELENLIGQNVVGSLKTTFGGNPTEGERRALQELGGLGSANKEVRKAIMARAKKALEEAADYRSARIAKIETGGYRKKTEAEGKK